MRMNGYPHEIRRPDDWCDYLEWQEHHLSLQGSSVVCKFNREYIIPLSKCKTPTSALVEAFTLAAHLAENEPDAYPSFVAKRFLDLIRKPQKLPHDLSQMFEDLSQAFDIRPKTRPQNDTNEP